MTLCMLGLKILKLFCTFLWASFKSFFFKELWLKYTIRHPFQFQWRIRKLYTIASCLWRGNKHLASCLPSFLCPSSLNRWLTSYNCIRAWTRVVINTMGSSYCVLFADQRGTTNVSPWVPKGQLPRPRSRNCCWSAYNTRMTWPRTAGCCNCKKNKPKSTGKIIFNRQRSVFAFLVLRNKAQSTSR